VTQPLMAGTETTGPSNDRRQVLVLVAAWTLVSRSHPEGERAVSRVTGLLPWTSREPRFLRVDSNRPDTTTKEER
jgi:hypothetical protein